MKPITYNNYTAEPGILAERETRYFLGIAQGLSDKQIARDCGVSPHTVGSARPRILYKTMIALGARTMVEAVLKAAMVGLIRELCVVLFLAVMLAPAARPTTDTQPLQRNRTRTSQTFRLRRELTYVAASA